MKTICRITLFAMTVLTFAACRKEMPVGPVENNSLKEIVFTANDSFRADVMTRVSETTESTLTSFQVLATTGSGTSQVTNPGFASSSFSGTSGSTFKGDKFWPASDPSYHFYAATKALTLANGAVTFKPSATIKDDVYAHVANAPYSGGNPPSSIALTFNHIYARVGKCTITGPSGYTVSNLSVKITPKVPTSNATFNVGTGSWSTTSSHYTNGTETTICSAVGNSGQNNDVWLVPSKCGSTSIVGNYTITASYTLSKAPYSESFTKTAQVELKMGKVNNISAALSPGNASEVTFTVDVTDWSDNNITGITF